MNCASSLSRKGSQNVNQYLYVVLWSKKGEAESHELPPCRDYLQESQLPDHSLEERPH